MTSVAPLRPDEEESLAALWHLEVLDTSPEPEFDALVHAAAQVCSMPTSLVSLVDMDRQWFKARFGFDGPDETARGLSFCAHAVLSDDLMVVDDASSDARFASHPLVRGAPFIRFYAGAPLRLSSGVRIGTLCVLDRVPRKLEVAQRHALERLAVAVVRALEGRSASRQLNGLRKASAAPATASQGFIELALGNVDQAMAQLLTAHEGVSRPPARENLAREHPAAGATSPAGFAAAEQPRHGAMRLCLTSTAALLGIANKLLHPECAATSAERVQVSQQLVEETKVAGRAAYRAGILLMDPHAEDQLPQRRGAGENADGAVDDTHPKQSSTQRS